MGLRSCTPLQAGTSGSTEPSSSDSWYHRPTNPTLDGERPDLHVAQLIYLLMSQDKLRVVLNAVSRRGVLILGRFGSAGPCLSSCRGGVDSPRGFVIRRTSFVKQRAAGTWPP
jgi:hypothetical protein